MKRPSLVSVLAVTFGLLSIRGGCGPGLPAPQAECLDRAAPSDGLETVVIGLGADDAFRPLADGEDLYLEFGTQGGQHVFVAFEYYAKDHDSWQHRFTAYLAGTEIELGSGGFIAEPCTPGWNQVAMFPVFVDTATTAPVRLEVESGPTEQGVPVRTIEATANVRFVAPT